MSSIPSPISALVTTIHAGTGTCVESVSRALDRIADTEPQVHAFISVNGPSALERARSLDALDASAKATMPLIGVPIAVKDNICTRGIATTCGSRMLERFIPPYNAGVVDALEEAGAVIVGKANLDEFAMGSSTENSFFGPTRNPHDLTRIPGGSSGGSVAAVASGEVPLALGSDTGGSIRQPCGHCGVAGLKPTYGRVSRYGLVAFASSLDQIGPVAHDVRDLGRLLSVISVADQRDSTNARRQFVDDPSIYKERLDGVAIGVPGEYFGEGLSSEVRARVESAIAGLVQRGAQLIDISLPNLQYAIGTYYIICTAEASSNLARYDGVKYGLRARGASTLMDMYTATREEGFGAEVKRRIMLGTYVLSSGYYDAYYLKAARVRTLISQDFDAAFTRCQAIVSPIAPTPAFALGEKTDDPLQMYLSDIYTVSANLAGIPAISVPCGKVGHLPVGVQFMAPKWREDTLLSLGFAVQSAQDSSSPSPCVAPFPLGAQVPLT